VQCYKKAPSDGGFSTLGSIIAVSPNGGNNTANCDATSIFGNNGTYQFYATATAGADSVTTDTVSVDYETSGPGTPTNYNKTQSGSCSFQITFHTANDSGKTVKVIIFRDDATSFNLDSGTMIGTVNIGSNVDGSFTNTPPDCSKTYYYELRAFDSYGNGSGIVGDTINVITTVSGASGPSSGALQGAIPAGTAGNVLVQATGPTGGATGTSGSVIGESTPAAQVVPYVPPSPSLVSTRTIIIAVAALALLALAWTLRKRENK
jgi:hypothetical protein